MSASNTNNTSLFGGSVGGMSGHHGDAGRKNQYNQMGQWDVASPNPQFGASAGATVPQSKSSSGISNSGAPHQASAGRPADKRGSLRNVSTSNNTRKSNHSRQSRGSRGGGAGPVPPGQAGPGGHTAAATPGTSSNQRRSLGLNNQRQYSGSTSQNRQQNMGVNMNQAPQQPSGYNHGQYALQNMAGGADAAMQNDQSLGAETNSL